MHYITSCVLFLVALFAVVPAAQAAPVVDDETVVVTEVNVTIEVSFIMCNHEWCPDGSTDCIPPRPWAPQHGGNCYFVGSVCVLTGCDEDHDHEDHAIPEDALIVNTTPPGSPAGR